MRWTQATLLALLSSCTFFRDAAVPMPAVLHPAPAGNAKGLIVMLPGMGDTPDDFVSHGFVAMVHGANPHFDVLCPDAHFGYYKNSSIVPRLYEDLLADAKSRYQHVWLLGISIGGMSSVVYASEHPGTIDGMILLAPFMGDREHIATVRAGGGLRAWQAPADRPEFTDIERRTNQVWSWYHEAVTRPKEMPKLFVGYGERDGLATPNAMVANELPPDQSMKYDGGHNWTTYTQLFAGLAPRALRELQ